MKKNLILALSAFLIGLLIAEFVLRFTGAEQPKFRKQPPSDWVEIPEKIWIEHHPVLGWYSQKNKVAVLESTHFQATTIHTNSAGFRGTREYAFSKRPDTLRIAALGDSYVFGWGVQDQETFPALLESLNSSREVLNLGVPGYGIDQIYLSYREIARFYHPDVVIIGLFVENFSRAKYAVDDAGHVKPYFSLSTFGKLVLHNVPIPPRFSITDRHFPLLVEQSFYQQILNYSVLYRTVKKLLINFATHWHLMDPDLTDEWLIGRAILHQLITEIRADGAIPVLLYIPPATWVMKAQQTPLEKSIIRFSQREKVALINTSHVLNALSAMNGIDKYFIQGDWHWSPMSHALVAEAIDQYLRNQK